TVGGIEDDQRLRCLLWCFGDFLKEVHDQVVTPRGGDRVDLILDVVIQGYGDPDAAPVLDDPGPREVECPLHRSPATGLRSVESDLVIVERSLVRHGVRHVRIEPEDQPLRGTTATGLHAPQATAGHDYQYSVAL